MPQTYDQAIREVRAEIRQTVDAQTLRTLHRRSGWRHALVALGPLLVLVVAVLLALRFGDRPWIWVPASIAIGFAIFSLTVLLHEVVHGLITERTMPRLRALLAWAYAVPSGLAASQFKRWHLDHHRWLGTDDLDPKRAELSPKRTARWLKALYFTPGLFPIYFRAAKRAGSVYPAELRGRIRKERWIGIGFHLGVLVSLIVFAGPLAALRVYVIPVFFVFPVAFTLNRIGQHYDVQASDPARWGTLLEPSPWLWDPIFLWSNYHLEHHLFPGVPCYRLRALRRALAPFFEARGVPSRSYGGLLIDWLLRNRKPHTDWARNLGA
jgi:fatty acid desaturase